MKKLVLAVVCTMLYIPLVGAYVIDGNVGDWGIDLNNANNMGYLDTNLPSGGLDIDVVTEDNTDASKGWVQVYPGWSYKNKFDAEAMYFDNDAHNAYIAIITGLPKSGSSGWDPGDIGIDTDGDNIYEFGINTATGRLYGSLDASDWDGVYYDGVNHNPDHSEAGPWNIIDDVSKRMDYVQFVYSSVQNTHYVLEASIPLNLLGLSANSGDPIMPLTIHWTMECGNDYLKLDADVNPVPEPASIMFMAMGLLGLAGIKFHRVRML